MNKPWELKIEDKRSSDTLYTFNIFCEGKNSEPYYLEWFETRKIKIITHGDQKTMCKNINKTISKCLENGVLKNNNGVYELYEDGMEIWCVFDRDKGSGGITLEEGDVEFNSAITIAKNSPIKIAWSNDSFELWILLHLEDIANNLEESKDRIYYYNRLTNYFKNHPNPNDLLQRTLRHPSFSYENDMKQHKKIKEILLPEILPYTIKAIERAKHLEFIHQNEYDIAKRSPCTMIFQLIERLIEIGGKVIPNAEG